ncbi:MAG: hypothetical protein HGA37_12145 [Lentimicrobium sp.]|nr:hypothetical protein [Lentimicrobium sp.]
MAAKSLTLKVFLMFVKLLIAIVIAIAGFFVYQTISEFDPEPAEPVAIPALATTIPDTITITTYNIGYCGLGAEMDFFYEGGKMVRPEKETFDKYLSGVMGRLSTFEESDFILLQEVDTLAKRSWYANQYRLIKNKFSEYHSFFTLNYKAWVPMPVLQPMGKVHAGIMTLGKSVPVEAARHAFATGYSWPMSLFMLKRCFLETRYDAGNGKQLVLLNTHNSAFSDAAEIRDKELAQLSLVMNEEYAKGNYVIIGGDWNQNPAVFDSTAVLDNYLVKTIKPPIPRDFLPEGWTYAYDPTHSTNRDVDIPYVDGKTKTTLIDFFVLSPNISLISAKTTPTGFVESDHQPVTVRLVLQK